MIDDRGEQAARATLPAMGRPHGEGQELRLIGRHLAHREARIPTIDLQQQTGHARQYYQFGKILPCPDALAEGHERFGVQRRRPVKIERPRGTMAKWSLIQSTVRRTPSGKVMLTPRR